MDKTSKCPRIVFMGTPAFASVVLSSIFEWKPESIVGVFTQPDRPSGRGKKICYSEVKQFALSRRLPVFQPPSFNSPDELDSLIDLAPDFLVVAAYGMILPQDVLDIPKYCPLNAHASLLPRYRGAAPIQRAIMNGDTITGVTIIEITKTLDSGPMYLQRSLPIRPYENAQDIHDQLATISGSMMIETITGILEAKLTSIVQNTELATYAPKIDKDECRLEWSDSASNIFNKVRALSPKPAAYTYLATKKGDIRISIISGSIGETVSSSVQPGTILGIKDEYLAIACSDREYLIQGLCPEGKKSMSPISFWNGYLNEK